MESNISKNGKMSSLKGATNGPPRYAQHWEIMGAWR